LAVLSRCVVDAGEAGLLAIAFVWRGHGGMRMGIEGERGSETADLRDDGVCERVYKGTLYI
jgi:hypothetical protein